MLFPIDAKYPDLHEEIALVFQEAQVELIHCPLCGDYHPPELHIAPTTPLDPIDPKEA